MPTTGRNKRSISGVWSAASAATRSVTIPFCNLTRLTALLATLLAINTAAQADERRAKNNYMLHCQGCHLATAQGLGDQVPRMNGFVGYFTHSEAGRRYLIQVPGSATAPVNDAELAELMNWILRTFSRDELKNDFVPYTVSEVTALRRTVEAEPDNRRSEILESLARSNKIIEQELAQ